MPPSTRQSSDESPVRVDKPLKFEFRTYAKSGEAAEISPGEWSLDVSIIT